MFLRVDADGRVIEVYNDAYNGLIQTDWLPDERGLMDERNVYRYKYTGGEVLERTAEEMDADYEKMPKHQPSDAERITALEEENKYLKEALDLLLSGATEEEGEADG